MKIFCLNNVMTTRFGGVADKCPTTITAITTAIIISFNNRNKMLNVNDRERRKFMDTTEARTKRTKEETQALTNKMTVIRRL